MSQENIDKRITDIIVDQLGVDVEAVTPTADIITDLGADSLDQVELIMAIEDEFEIEISDEEAEKAKTVQEIIDTVTRLTDAS